MDTLIYKNYRIVPLGTFAMFKIQPPGSGDIPKELEGNFTTTAIAKQTIDRYTNTMLTKVKRKRINDEKDSAVTG